MMTHNQLRQILSIFVNISLKLLPVYASDFPPQDKRSYFKFLVQWARRSQAVIDHFICKFKQNENATNSKSRISMRRFVEACKEQDIFNVLSIREVAKSTNTIENTNPHISRQSLGEKDLFASRESFAEMSAEIEEDLKKELPKCFKEAYLYRVGQEQDETRVAQTNKRADRREQRLYLEMIQNRAIGTEKKANFGGLSNRS